MSHKISETYVFHRYIVFCADVSQQNWIGFTQLTLGSILSDENAIFFNLI